MDGASGVFGASLASLYTMDDDKYYDVLLRIVQDEKTPAHVKGSLRHELGVPERKTAVQILRQQFALVPNDVISHINAVLNGTTDPPHGVKRDRAAAAASSDESGDADEKDTPELTDFLDKCVVSAQSGTALVIDQKRTVWSAEVREKLFYYIDRSTFEEKSVDQFVIDFSQAATDWSSACGVRFREVFSESESIFQVRRLAQGKGKSATIQGALAVAFFPFESDRVLEVYPKLWDPSALPIVGILRHELGHVLGFMHEFALDDEAMGWKKLKVVPTRLGKRNPKSVMNYPWKAGFSEKNPNWEMTITDQDKAEARMIYGAPFTEIQTAPK